MGARLRPPDHLQARVPQVPAQVHRLRAGEDQGQGDMVLKKKKIPTFFFAGFCVANSFHAILV